ncbi:hypothetical protein [Mesorhizobium sp. CAU 1741]|uniref:hypothetical protein n=1 Tax=Mesorhizobium sp. CAU 1741 TaxID=3140366 RepID=UPI00325BE6CD
MFDGKAFGAEIVGAVKVHLADSLRPIVDRLDALERKIDAAPRPSVDASDLDAVKTDVDGLRRSLADQVTELRRSVDGIVIPEIPVLPDVDKIVADAIAVIPEPEPVKTVTIDDLRPEIETAVQSAVDAQPKAPTVEELATVAASLVKDAVAAIPAPQDGKSVTVDDVRPLIEEATQKAVAALPVAKDGVGLASMLIDRNGCLVATMTDGSTKELGQVVGKDADMAAIERSIVEKVAAIPKPRDGFSLSDFDATLMDDGRTVLLSFDQGEQSFKVELGIPAMIYRGVFKEGRSYEKGDTVTWGGSLWHCDVDATEEKPDSQAKHWTLAAKRGRDGKDAVVKAEKPQGPLKLA